jgi:hypothetical protein
VKNRKVDLDAARKFLKTLAPDTSEFTWQVFSDNETLKVQKELTAQSSDDRTTGSERGIPDRRVAGAVCVGGSKRSTISTYSAQAADRGLRCSTPW